MDCDHLGLFRQRSGIVAGRANVTCEAKRGCGTSQTALTAAVVAPYYDDTRCASPHYSWWTTRLRMRSRSAIRRCETLIAGTIPSEPWKSQMHKQFCRHASFQQPLGVGDVLIQKQVEFPHGNVGWW